MVPIFQIFNENISNKTLVESVQLGKTLDSVFVSPSTGERVKCDEKGGGLCKVE